MSNWFLDSLPGPRGLSMTKLGRVYTTVQRALDCVDGARKRTTEPVSTSGSDTGHQLTVGLPGRTLAMEATQSPHRCQVQAPISEWKNRRHPQGDLTFTMVVKA